LSSHVYVLVVLILSLFSMIVSSHVYVLVVLILSLISMIVSSHVYVLVVLILPLISMIVRLDFGTFLNSLIFFVFHSITKI
jgi:hypothetical protein